MGHEVSEGDIFCSSVLKERYHPTAGRMNTDTKNTDMHVSWPASASSSEASSVLEHPTTVSLVPAGPNPLEVPAGGQVPAGPTGPWS